MTNALLGWGTTFGIESDSTPGVYETMAEVFNVTAPNSQTDQVEATHNESANREREYIAGLVEPGEASFEMNFIPGSVSDTRILALKTAGTSKNCRITFPNDVTWDFVALITGYEPATPTDDRMTATVTMKVSGSTVVTVP